MRLQRNTTMGDTISMAGLLLAAAMALPASAGVQAVNGAPDPGLRIGDPSAGVRVTHVCVDTASSPAWVLSYGLTDGSAPCARADLRKLSLAQYTGAAFRGEMQAWMKHQAYPDMDVLAQIAEFIAQMPGAPIGLTWDGGMAITANDYDAAEKRHAQYLADPERFARENWQR